MYKNSLHIIPEVIKKIFHVPYFLSFQHTLNCTNFVIINNVHFLLFLNVGKVKLREKKIHI